MSSFFLSNLTFPGLGLFLFQTFIGQNIYEMAKAGKMLPYIIWLSYHTSCDVCPPRLEAVAPAPLGLICKQIKKSKTRSTPGPWSSAIHWPSYGTPGWWDHWWAQTETASRQLTTSQTVGRYWRPGRCVWMPQQRLPHHLLPQLILLMCQPLPPALPGHRLLHNSGAFGESAGELLVGVSCDLQDLPSAAALPGSLSVSIQKFPASAQVLLLPPPFLGPAPHLQWRHCWPGNGSPSLGEGWGGGPLAVSKSQTLELFLSLHLYEWEMP